MKLPATSDSAASDSRKDVGAAALEQLENQLKRVWRSGRNAVVGWRRIATGLELMAVPQYLLPDLLSNHERLLDGNSEISQQALTELSEVCEIEPYQIAVPGVSAADWIDERSLARIVRRYGVTRMSDKAVILFDIVGFSRLSPLEQVAALNNLSYSINIAHRRAQEHGIDLSLSNTTTGDGFYVWSEDNGLDANLAMFCILMLTLADNALGHEKGMSRTMPVIRTCFHVGSCYEFYQADGEGPRPGSFIVGESTIVLARMMGSALPRQILVGNFITREVGLDKPADTQNSLTTPGFMKLARKKLQEFADLRLAGERVTAIKSYLTGDPQGEDDYRINRYMITDKHGYQHEVFNAKVNVHRRRGGAIYLGLPSSKLGDFNAATKITQRIRTRQFAETASSAKADPGTKPVKSPSLKILVVDDDPYVRATTVAMVEALGHQVLEAEHGPAAQRIMEVHENVDLLMTDMVMPGGLGGIELARYAARRTPGIKVLIITGYGAELSLVKEQVPATTMVLGKPYMQADLEEKIQALLSTARGELQGDDMNPVPSLDRRSALPMTGADGAAPGTQDG